MEIHAGHQFSRTNVPNVHRIECCVVVFAGLCHFVNLQLQSCFNQRVGFSKSKGPWDSLERGFPRPSQFPCQPNCGYKNCRPSFHNSIFFLSHWFTHNGAVPTVLGIEYLQSYPSLKLTGHFRPFSNGWLEDAPFPVGSLPPIFKHQLFQCPPEGHGQRVDPRDSDTWVRCDRGESCVPTKKYTA